MTSDFFKDKVQREARITNIREREFGRNLSPSPLKGRRWLATNGSETDEGLHRSDAEFAPHPMTFGHRPLPWRGEVLGTLLTPRAARG
jgi:hypothetical protein